MKRITLEVFKESDWMAFAGAERTKDGRLPQIGEMKIDKRDAVVVVDANGVGIYPNFEEGEEAFFFQLDIPFDAGRLLVHGMKFNTSEKFLMNGLGFTKAEC